MIYTKDSSSGRVHKRIAVGDALFTDERCNLDQAGAYEVIDEDALADEPDKCRRCFPPDIEGAPV